MPQAKRVFIGCSVQANWPTFPNSGKVVSIEDRHMTLAFLGKVTPEEYDRLKSAPRLHLEQPIAIQCSELRAFPPRSKRALAYLTSLHGCVITKYQHTLSRWLKAHNYRTEERPFLPHITIARGKFDMTLWKAHFSAFEAKITGVYLYESMGHGCYKKRFTLLEDAV